MIALSELLPYKSLGPTVPPMGTQGDLSSDFESILLQGTIEHVTYYNPESAQYIIDFKPFNSRQHFLVGGFAAPLYPGSSCDLELWVSSNQKQILMSEQGHDMDQTFSARKIVVKSPTTTRTLKKFLKSISLGGVGTHTAKMLAQAFPENFFEVLNEKSHLLLDVQGIGKKKQTQILKGWAEFNYISEFEKYLFENNLPVNWARALWSKFGLGSLDYLKTNAYEAIRDQGFDFSLIDAYRIKAGQPPTTMIRLRMGLYSILKEHYQEGHCAHPEEKLLLEAEEKLAVRRELLEEALEIELLEESFMAETINNTPCIYLREVWDTEQNVAKKLLAFVDKEPPWGWFNLEKVMHWSQSLLDIQLAPMQQQAIETALSSSLTVITGGPGTGKTTLIKSLVTILKTQFASFVLCSPTGRGAQRLEEATGAPSQTIHRMLKYSGSTGGFLHNKNNPLNVDLVLVDEVSMVDISLMSHLLNALPPTCAIILVGDVDQIPPVGAGNILQSLIQSKKFNIVKLTEIFRQRDQSAIKLNALRINQGKMPEDSAGGDFHYLPAKGVEAIRSTLVDLVTKTIPLEYGIADFRQIQVLAPKNKGPLGTVELNRHLQDYLSMHPTLRPKTIASFDQKFKVGDKVMSTKNDYRKKVFNGDIGFITHIDHFEQLIEVQFDHGGIFYHFEELDKLSLAYAISIHKSQGSEYKAVIVVIGEEHLPLAQRQLIYTAVTRGKEQVFLVAEPRALQAAVLSDENNLRWHKLTELLAAGTPVQ